MNKYKLIFSGQLLENVDKKSCVNGLAQIFKKKPEIIEKKLFSGKKVTVKVTTDRQVVDRYISAFKKVNLVSSLVFFIRASISISVMIIFEPA